MFGNILTTLLSPASFSAPGGFSIHGPALLVLPSIVLFLALAIGSLVWVWNDAQKRNKNSFIVLLFVLLTAGLPPSSGGSGYARRLKSKNKSSWVVTPRIFPYSLRVTTEDAPSTNPPSPLRPQEGLSALHLFYRVNLAEWRTLSPKDQAYALDHLDALISLARQEPETQVKTMAMFARADIGFMILSPDLHALNALEKKLTASLGPDVLVPEFTYLSMTEKSEYTQKDDDYAAELAKTEGIPVGSAESEAKLITFRERIQHYTHDRLYPVLPDWEYYCFYPMSKRRAVGQNWYALDHARRRELMGGHMRVGRTYAGRVRQLVTGSTGLDDWEWGVTLFAHNPYDIKAIVYEMRFDEVTHTYGEFGPFYNGLPLPMREIYKRVLLV